MGDLFGHWDSLYNADEEQRNHLMTEDSTSSNENYTHGEYLKLAAKNNSHFAGENLKAWAELHQKAIEQAMTSGKDEAKFNQAPFIEAASTHFLTDAFSSGHQFEKQPLLDAVQIDLKKHPLITGPSGAGGTGAGGALGDGRGSDAWRPQQVRLPGRAVQIVATERNSCARLEDRCWYCWGDNRNGAIAGRNEPPALAPVLLDLSRVE